jgi:predicted nucleic acid-binding protein
VTPVLLDTGCIVALLDRSERHHAHCVAAVEAAEGPLVTCEAVIAESCHLLRRQRGAPDAILENVANGVFRIPFRLDESSAAVRTLMKRYARTGMDLADACLVAMADLLDTGRILTLDGDFRVYRWRRVRAFDLLVDLASS